MIDAGAEEYYNKIENQSNQASVGTKLVQLLGSTMTVSENPLRSLSVNVRQKPPHRGFEGKYFKY